MSFLTYHKFSICVSITTVEKKTPLQIQWWKYNSVDILCYGTSPAFKIWLKGQKYLFQNYTQNTKSISSWFITQNESQCFCKTHISDPFSVSPQLLTLSSTTISSIRSAWAANPAMTSRRHSASLTRTRVASLRRRSWSRHHLLVFTFSHLQCRDHLSWDHSEFGMMSLHPKAPENLGLPGCYWCQLSAQV